MSFIKVAMRLYYVYPIFYMQLLNSRTNKILVKKEEEEKSVDRRTFQLYKMFVMFFKAGKAAKRMH